MAHLTSCCFDIRRSTVQVLVLLPEVEQRRIHPLCAAHNRYLAELAFGREYVERCIDLRPREQLGPKTTTEA